MTDECNENVIIPFYKSSELLTSEWCEFLLNPPVGSKIFGFERLTDSMGGLRPREFTILCGATGSGKTTLLANLSWGLLQNEVPHFVGSFETGHVDFLIRTISAAEGMDYNTGNKVSIDEVKRLSQKYDQYLGRKILNLSLYDNRVPHETMINDIKWANENLGVKIAMIDNFNFSMPPTRANDQLIEMDRVIHDFVMFCKTTDIHIVMVMHPKKTDHGRVESEFDIKGSSTSVQESHNVWLFNRPHEDAIKNDIARAWDREIKFAKIRRKGLNTGKRLILRCQNGVKYEEGETYAI